MGSTYPQIIYRGQYSLERVLTFPNHTTTPVTTDDIDKPVELTSDGIRLATGSGIKNWGILRSVSSDGVVTVDYAGVHDVAASAELAGGASVIITNGKLVAGSGDFTRAMLLQPATADDVANGTLLPVWLNP